MKAKVKTIQEVEITTLLIDAGVRYWEDAKVNGVEDENGDLIPCKFGDRWKPIINIDSGVITNWKKGVVANIHYKVCDDGTYHLADADGNIWLTKDGYVPNILDITRDSYGDYIIMKVDEDGKISNWNKNPNIKDFQEDEDE